MEESNEGLEQLEADLVSLKDKVELSKYAAVAVSSQDPSLPTTTLMHVRLREDLANVQSLARYLWGRAANYALSRKRRLEFDEQIAELEPGDLSVSLLVAEATRDAFIEFTAKYPQRASEIGELLAYCIAIEQLGAAQLAAKMSLKTNNNMPVHGLDGIHAVVEDGWLTVYFLESKLNQTANGGAADFAESVADFASNKKQYKLEYSIVRDLGNFDTLNAKSREVALRHFDIMASPDEVPKRERYVGVVLYSDDKLFKSLPPVSKGQKPGFHERELAAAYAKQLDHHQQSALKHLTKQGADPNKCLVYFIVTPDIDELRKLFYDVMGYVPKVVKA
ncbi:HamA C-terminal domain-containing protein [Aquabacterium sp.]|uniref:HamA C-terminal domain-containing protein n=1 Tax=Aquabacterium sp. TaxID=1872578 RepID=UPI003D6D2DA5